MERMMIPQESFDDICRLLGSLSGEVKTNTKMGYTCYKVPISFWYNRSTLDQSSSADIKAAVEEVLEERKGENPILISCTQENLASLPDRILGEKGFSKFSCQIGMIKDLESYVPLEDDRNIIRVDKSRLEEWAGAVAAGFGKPFEITPFELLIERKDCYFYAYLQEGKIAGTALLYADSENAGIHEVSTLPEHRRKQIANHLIVKILNTAKELNIPTASLQASELGEKVYSGLGFEKVSVIPTWILGGEIL